RSLPCTGSDHPTGVDHDAQPSNVQALPAHGSLGSGGARKPDRQSAILGHPRNGWRCRLRKGFKVTAPQRPGAVTVSAEDGVNHNGKLDLALALVDAAAAAGADVVKFQTFRADQLTTRSARKADYQTRNTGTDSSQLDMLKTLELDDEAHRKLLARCQERGVAFLSTPFDHVSLGLLVDGLGLSQLKVGSGDLTNAPILLA